LVQSWTLYLKLMATYLWKRYAAYLHTKWEKTFLWDSIEHYKRPQTFTPLVILYASAFYTGVIGAAITEQLYKVHHIVVKRDKVG
ncbi:embryo defective, partial [Thalictrum thalictroides]